jgi:hypothetical protein
MLRQASTDLSTLYVFAVPDLVHEGQLPVRLKLEDFCGEVWTVEVAGQWYIEYIKQWG